jgi:hypothetical protein
MILLLRKFIGYGKSQLREHNVDRANQAAPVLADLQGFFRLGFP